MRPPLALERLTESARGQVVFELPHPRADGATHLLLDPLELIEKLTLLIPPPRFPPEFHHGVTSPCVSRLDYPARFGLDRSGLGEPRLLTSQAVQIAPSTSNITLPPR